MTQMTSKNWLSVIEITSNIYERSRRKSNGHGKFNRHLKNVNKSKKQKRKRRKRKERKK